MPRLFGTDGIRGIANVDLKPTLAYSLGRATAHRLAGRGRLHRRRPGHAPLRRHVRGRDRGRRDEHRRGRPQRRCGARRRPSPISPAPATSPPASWFRPRTTRPVTTASRSWTSAASSSTRTSRTSSSSSSGSRRSCRAAPADALGRTVDARELLDTLLRPSPRPGPPVQDAICTWSSDCANGSGCVAAGADPDRDRRARRGHLRRSGRYATSTPGAAPRRPPPWRRKSCKRGADVGFALDGDADRLIAVDANGCVVDGDAVLGILALDRIAGGNAAQRRSRRLGAVQRRTAAGRSRRPAARSFGRRSGTSTSSKGCSSTAPDWAARRAATSSSWSTRRAATASSPPWRSWP